MTNPRLVITGAGAISALGVGRRHVYEALLQGRTGIGASKLLDAQGIDCPTAGEIVEFDPAGVLGGKGLRLMDRTTLLALVATHLALEEAGLDPAAPLGPRAGVCLGTGTGSLESRCGFYIDRLTSGFRGVNPARFSNTVFNAPSSQVSIRFGATGLNVTVTAGGTSGLAALEHASMLLAEERVDLMLVGGAEELSAAHALGIRLLGEMSPDVAGAIPFSAERRGILPGEGAAMVVLETERHARARGAPILATYAGGRHATAYRSGKGYEESRPLERAIDQALGEAGLSPSAIGFAVSGANGSVAGDHLEATTIARALGDRSVPTTAPKASFGETHSAAGPLGVAVALSSLEWGLIPPIFGLDQVDPSLPLDPVVATPRAVTSAAALVVATCPSGHQVATILTRPLP